MCLFKKYFKFSFSHPLIAHIFLSHMDIDDEEQEAPKDVGSCPFVSMEHPLYNQEDPEWPIDPMDPLRGRCSRIQE